MAISHHRLWQTSVIIGLLEVIVSNASISAAVYDQYTPSRHNRFASENVVNASGQSVYQPNTNPDYVLSDYDLSDLSGIGVGTPNPGLTANHSTSRAVLITPRHYIGASHAGEIDPRFVGSDGVSRPYTASGSHTRLTTYFDDGTSALSDIALYTLDFAIPASDGVSPLAIFDGSFSSLIGKEFFLAADQINNTDATGMQTGELTHRVGKNIIRDVVVVGFGGSDPSPSVSIEYTFDPTDPSKGSISDREMSDTLGIDEAGLIGGDSGNSAFIDVDGELAIIGAHLGISSSADAANGNFYKNYSTLLAPYLDEIGELVAADGQSIARRSFSVSAVPEPNCFFCLSIALLGLVHRRRR